MSEIITVEKSIRSCNDFELNIDRTQELLYKFSYPKSKKIQGIVFTIHGFGADPSYMENLRLFIAKEFSVVAVDVFYHCFSSRPNNGATLEFDDIDVVILQDIIDKYKIDFSNVIDINTNSVINTLNDQIGKLKAEGTLRSDFKLTLPITLIPKNNEYQNFGIMQAVDHINVLQEIEKMPLNFAKNHSVSLMGTSHGGYLAHLIAKLAPHKIDSVIDNSSYVQAPMSYFLGKETNILKPESTMTMEHVVLNCFVQTLWSTNTKSPYFFSSNHYMIRDLSNDMHINCMHNFTDNKTKYISYHSTQDSIANVDDKINFYQKLDSFGFTTELNIIDNNSQIDGKFIKTLSHGMNMSLKELAKKELAKVLILKTEKHNEDTDIIYKCDNITYSFKYKNNNLKIEVL